MSISKNTQDREKQKFVESTVTAGKPVVAVSNSDGTPIGGGTGASANQVQGTAADNAASVGNPVLVGGYYESGTDTYADGDAAKLHMDVNGNLKNTLATSIAGEDIPNDVLKTEHRYSYLNMSADTLVKTGAGFLHTLTFAQIDAAPTAGTIIVYDNTAESGTIIFSSTWTTAIFYPTTVTLDVSFLTGLYIGFTTTADIGVTASYR